MMNTMDKMNENELENERWIDDDYEMINQFYTAKT